jgi:phosphoribosyl 1,2-cyclic phosphodiesterase
MVTQTRARDFNMKLTVINSNSAGNCYLLENSQEALIIECGVAIARIKQALNFDLSKVAGCVVSHEHLDHCKSVNDLLNAGIDVYASPGTHGAMNTAGHHRALCISPGEMKRIGKFEVKAFDTKHDCAEPLGFLIRHEQTGVILFLTDSYYSEYRFDGLNNIIIEANHCQDILDRRLASGANPKFLRDRVITSHMNLKTCKELLQANDLTQVNNVLLIHLSDGNSDAKRFQREIQEATGKVVWIADPGLSIPFNKTAF